MNLQTPIYSTTSVYLVFSLWAFTFFFVLFAINGPSNFAEACRTILSGIVFAVVELLPALVLATTITAVFSFTFLTLLAWFSVLVRHDCSDIPYFQAQWTKHAFKLWMVLSEDRYPAVLFRGLDCAMVLLVYLFIYERRKFAKHFKRELAKRLAIEDATAHAQRTAQRSVKQLAEADASLTCLICVDRLTQPYTLAPCGHTFDLECLQTWFRTAHPSPADEELARTLDPRGALYALRRKKFCPLCHTEVVGCPVPTRALQGLGMATPEEREPWKGLFGLWAIESAPRPNMK
ncbi:hypothetical protein B0H17DRAFT_1329094 [Mycena rosella]|uniref:RING-type domain-containing protein n=1 Tax=Mycena rosella TaxID=1033263 RepID=A0AAD7DSR3_MYCRO|nr:hypothetical protein B0H17DRAFT_1329094 [Mycena rosella]